MGEKDKKIQTLDVKVTELKKDFQMQTIYLRGLEKQFTSEFRDELTAEFITKK
ncbi:hypothetical protein [Clostridium ljungdahlii]|uniref:Uncharacterized protein n=1 Tax=Clostridium ljungdahlii (strain ATCC 55383 / DSM 13528 / PETC) TaxID=748727 RepID=A0ABX2TYL3_CLOLD|nr:hypothetical protein [Clostridium ljungdahlii]OAA89441.1 hypothetical protein WX45_01273 [Clostridium ljungdahlii DSM 13528]